MRYSFASPTVIASIGSTSTISTGSLLSVDDKVASISVDELEADSMSPVSIFGSISVVVSSTAASTLSATLVSLEISFLMQSSSGEIFLVLRRLRRIHVLAQLQ